MSGGGVDPLSLIKRFSADEKNLSSELFLSPCVPGGKINVKLKGAVYELRVVDSGPLVNGCGFGLFQVTQPGQARCVERASRSQIDAYLKLLPRVNMVLAAEFQSLWWGLQLNTSDTRLILREPVPIRLTERSASFQAVHARFDGASFWYHGENRRRDPNIARKLREALDGDLAPDAVRVSGATPPELLAYKILYFDKHPSELRDQHLRNRSDIDRIRDALAHLGARLDAHWNNEEQGSIVVRYVVDDQTHTANIRVNDLSVVSSGICLSGRDQDFDLTSLVGVMRQYHGRLNGDADQYD